MMVSSNINNNNKKQKHWVSAPILPFNNEQNISLIKSLCNLPVWLGEPESLTKQSWLQLQSSVMYLWQVGDSSK